jgi:hypothetical protein
MWKICDMGEYSQPLLMKQKKKGENLLRNSHRLRKQNLILFLLRDCEEKIYKRSANHYLCGMIFIQDVQVQPIRPILHIYCGQLVMYTEKAR